MESVITQLETMMNKRISEKSRGYLALVGTVFCLALGPLIVKSSEAPGVVSSFYRMSIAAIAITPFFCLSLKREKSIQSGRTKIPQFAILLPIFAGISSAIDHSLWGTAVKMTNLNNAMVLNSISPIWVSLFSLLFLHEKFRNQFWAGLAGVIIGIFFISGFSVGSFSVSSSRGDILAFVSSFFYAGYFTLSQLGRKYFSAIKQSWLSDVFCSLAIGLIILLFNFQIIGFSLRTYMELIVLGVLCQGCGYFLVTYALGKLPASIVSPCVESMPIFSSLLAWLILDEPLHSNQVIGSLLILVSIILINNSQTVKKGEG